MRFPELSRRGAPAHASASDRVALARREQRRLAGHANAVIGTSDAHETASLLHEATMELEAREAWLGWIERGV